MKAMKYMKYVIALLVFGVILIVGLSPQMSVFNQSKGKKEQPPLPAQPYTKTKNDFIGAAKIDPNYKPPAGTPGLKKWNRWGKLKVHVIDGRTGKPLSNADIVLAENGYRTKTDQTGWTPEFPAPVIRDPRFTEILSRLHGQLTLIAYQNGYRDTILFDVRMREGLLMTPEVTMYEITPQDRRIEPMVFHYPNHHIFVTDLAEQYRTKSQPGQGFESPDLNR